jgi:hypothetical protein
MYRLEPWGNDWDQATRIEAAIKNAFSSSPVCPSELIPNEDNRKSASEEVDEATLSQRWKTRLGF